MHNSDQLCTALVNGLPGQLTDIFSRYDKKKIPSGASESPHGHTALQDTYYNVSYNQLIRTTILVFEPRIVDNTVRDFGRGLHRSQICTRKTQCEH